MGRAKIDNPLFSKTEGKSTSLKVLNSKTLKVKESKTQEEDPQESKTKETPQKNGHEFKTLKLPKFKTCNDPLLVRLRSDQAEYLAKLESSIMKGRSKQNRKERITKNSIIRVAIDMIRNMEIDHREISNEEDLFKRIMDIIRRTK